MYINDSNSEKLTIKDNFNSVDFSELSYSPINKNQIYSLSFVIYNRSNDRYIDSLNIQNISDYYKLQINKDGWISVVHSYIPSIEYIKSCVLNTNKKVLCSDGKYLYVYQDKKFNKINQNYLFDILDNSDFIFYYNSKNIIYTWYIENKYLSLVIKELSNNLSYETELIKNYIDVLEYLIRKELNEEAQRLLEQFENCSRLQSNNIEWERTRCGCNQKIKNKIY